VIGEVFVINLDRSVERMEQFTRLNAHVLGINRFSAIDGAALSRDALLKDGIVLEDCPYSAGTLGCALSHVSLWRMSVQTGRAVTVMEDDVIACEDFRETATRLISEITCDCDYIQWGYIVDRLGISLDFGVTKAAVKFFGYKDRCFDFSQARPHLYPLLNCWGTQSYTVFPSGAKHLLDSCLPLRRRTIQFSEPGVSFWDEGIDGPMNDIYPRMSSHICVPPLVVHAPPSFAASDRIAID
jgi:GR25 family glycosyltransferase involved in LPS biosynthesis